MPTRERDKMKHSNASYLLRKTGKCAKGGWGSIHYDVTDLGRIRKTPKTLKHEIFKLPPGVEILTFEEQQEKKRQQEIAQRKLEEIELEEKRQQVIANQHAELVMKVESEETAEALVELGWFYISTRMYGPVPGRACFERALELNPQSLDAKRYITLLDMDSGMISAKTRKYLEQFDYHVDPSTAEILRLEKSRLRAGVEESSSAPKLKKSRNYVDLGLFLSDSLCDFHGAIEAFEQAINIIGKDHKKREFKSLHHLAIERMYYILQNHVSPKQINKMKYQEYAELYQTHHWESGHFCLANKLNEFRGAKRLVKPDLEDSFWNFVQLTPDAKVSTYFPPNVNKILVQMAPDVFFEGMREHSSRSDLSDAKWGVVLGCCNEEDELHNVFWPILSSHIDGVHETSIILKIPASSLPSNYRGDLENNGIGVRTSEHDLISLEFDKFLMQVRNITPAEYHHYFFYRVYSAGSCLLNLNDTNGAELRAKVAVVNYSANQTYGHGRCRCEICIFLLTVQEFLDLTTRTGISQIQHERFQIFESEVYKVHQNHSLGHIMWNPCDHIPHIANLELIYEAY